jgi:hypothetical protein
MTCTDLTPSSTHLARAGTLLAAVAERDFDRLADAFEPELAAIAVLPGGVFQWPDRTTVRGVFEQWFGDVEEYDVTDLSASRLGRRLHARWRVTVSGGHLGSGRHVVEQQLYADTGPTGRIATMSFLCSGFCRVRTDG